jgi:hypothetical protein
MIRFLSALLLTAAAWAAAQAIVPTAAPIAPVPAFPADKAINISVYTNLKWKKTAGATLYHVQLATDSAFASPAFEDSTLADTLVQMRKIADSTLFYWRVRAGNATGFGPYSKIRSFTTQPPLGAGPSTVAPENNALGVALAPTLVWNAFPGAKSYGIQVSLMSNFGTLLFEDTGVADTTRKLPALEKGTTYYWHVRANTAPVKTGWTKASFMTMTDPPSDPASLTAPAADAVNQPLPVDFSWGPVARATGYLLQISGKADFSAVLRTDTTEWSYASVEGLAPNATYYWRVRGISGTGQGPWSEAGKFQTAAGTGVLAGAMRWNAALRAFPMGSGNNVRIEFELPARSRVRILAYGPTGGHAEALAEGMMDAGLHRFSVPWNRNAAGVRFIEMRSEGARQVIRIVSP